MRPINARRRGVLTLLAGTTLLSSSVLLAGAGQRDSDQHDDAHPEKQIPPHIAARMARGASGGAGSQNDLPKFEDISEGFEQVISTIDRERPLYNVWKRERDAQILAELPPNFERQLLFFAYTVKGGIPTAGVQFGDRYLRWKRYDNRLALIEPNFDVRTTGDVESRKAHERVFTDRVLLDIPIAAQGPNGGLVINLTDLLIGQSARFFGNLTAGARQNLLEIESAKAFPENVEVGYKLPLRNGRIATLHYSINIIPERTGYRPRPADTRVGYFTTAYRDVGDPSAETPWVRYINRWHMEKAEPSLRMSPPKEPIIFYIEHTTPIRYRQWVREGILEWNRAFERIGITNAIEVRQQDARTGAYMDKDPEDARYNFVLWTNAGMGFAIGPSRVDPRTGQILDADVVLDEGFITHWVRAWRQLVPDMALETFGPKTLSWLETRPQWDPRVRLAPPEERQDVIDALQAQRADRGLYRFAGHPAANVDPTLLGDDRYDGLAGRTSQVSGMCVMGIARSLDIALFRYNAELLLELAAGLDDSDETDDPDQDEDEDTDEEKDDIEDDEEPARPERPDPTDTLDGVPDSFIGPLLRELVMHEIGHALGLRHNFKASGIYSIEQINSPEHVESGKTISGSVMDYNPININFGDGEIQGDYSMRTIGPYDYWAIEYGYSFDRDLSPILARVSEPELAYATDEDTWGPDPMARRFDLGDDPLEYCESQMRLVQHLRNKIIERVVEDGESWAKARRAYELLLSRQFNAVSIAANWIGGSTVHRDHKGDPGERRPIENISADQQRTALKFIIENAFQDDAFGLTSDLLHKMTVEKWWDAGGQREIFADPTWPVHDRILGIQASAMTMVLNPTTLNRVYDNEFRIDPEEDAVTLPEVMFGISDAVWSELDEVPDRQFTTRDPLISSLRRNLQSEHLKRTIDLSLPNRRLGAAAKPISNLSVFQLRQLQDKIDTVMTRRANRLDPYTLAHLDEARTRIEKALDAQYIYNTDAIGAGGGLPIIFLHPDQEKPDSLYD